MQNTTLKISAELAQKVQAHLKSFSGEIDAVARYKYADIVAGVDEKAKKIQQDNGTFDVIISTEDLDRTGEIVRQDGWDMGNYKNNPTVLWGHDYYAMPIGACLETYTTTTFRGVPATGARGIFLSADINPFAQQIRKLYDFGLKQGAGVGTTTSVGFIPKGFDPNNNTIIVQAELLEFSFVPVPANQGVGPAQARRLTSEEIVSLGLDVQGLRVKGITDIFEIKDNVLEEIVPKAKKDSDVGASCELPDGTLGILVTDPTDPDGPLVCIGTDQDKSATKPTMDKLMKKISDEHDRHEESTAKAFDDFRTKAATVVEDQPDMNDEDGKKKAADEGPAEFEKCMKSLKTRLADEHEMHRAKNIDTFRSYEPPEEKKKAAEPEEYLKAVRTEHKAYEDKCQASFDTFETKAVQGGPGEVDEHTDWIVGKVKSLQSAHRKAVKKIGSEMGKAFGEPDQTEEKMWWTKSSVAEELAESQERQQKYKKVDSIWNVFDAFICAYLDDSTPVADFEKLLDEAVGLMKGSSDEAKGLIKSYFVSAKAGAKLSAATKEKLVEAHDSIMKGVAVIHALHGNIAVDEGDSGESGEEHEGPEPTDKKNEHGATEDKELETFLITRDLARALAGSLNETLSESRGLLKDYYQKSRK
jgi:hypothetical protein